MQYDRHVKLFARWCAAHGHSGAIDSIDHETVATFLASREARTRPDGGLKKAVSMNALRTSVRVFFGYLHQAGYIRQNPARLVRLAVCGAPPPRALSEEETKRLVDTLAAGAGPEAERDHAMFHLMLATGIRLGSAIALDVQDVDLDNGELHLATAKGDRRERVYLGRAIRAHLRRFIGQRTAGPLFVAMHGGRLSPRHVQRRFKMWVQKAGIARASSTHCLRHSLAVNLYKRTGDLLLVKAALRHKSIASTLVYARLDEGRLRRAMEG
jgi:site-specific recombinase XerD